METTGQEITISVCMMVKDEEDNLKRALPSINGLADELIVVDTGSSDGTIELAKSFGAQIHQHPFEGEYIDDFSKYRNLSISYATGDWLLIFDADEELICESVSAVKEFLANAPDECKSIAIALHDIQQNMQAMQFNSVRLFRRGHVRYEGIVHNAAKIIDGRPEAVFCPLLAVKHYGYDLTPEKQQQKRARSERLLLKRLEQNPDDVVAIFYLVQSYTAYDEFDKAAEYIERYRETSERTNVEFNGSIYTTAVHVYRKLLDKKNAQRWLLEGLKKYPEDLDLLMNLTEYGVWVQDINLMAQGAKAFLKAYDKYKENPLAAGNRFTYANTPESVCFCLFHLSMGMFQQACSVLDRLGETLKETQDDYHKGVRRDVAIVFEAFGLRKDDWEDK